MADTIRHQGIVENINGTHLQVRIVQTSACASCSIKGHCSSADTKEKLIDVIDESSSYQPGDRVWVVGELSMGVMAVLLAFVLPFLVLIFSLFAFMAMWHDELVSALCSFCLLYTSYDIHFMAAICGLAPVSCCCIINLVFRIFVTVISRQKRLR